MQENDKSRSYVYIKIGGNSCQTASSFWERDLSPLFAHFWHCPLKPFRLPFLFFILTYFKNEPNKDFLRSVFWDLQNKVILA